MPAALGAIGLAIGSLLQVRCAVLNGQYTLETWHPPRRPTARLPVARIQPRFLAGPQHHLLTWLADLADLNTTAFRRPTWSSANPGKLNYGSSGASMVTLIEAENFNSRAAWRRKRSGQLPDQG